MGNVSISHLIRTVPGKALPLPRDSLDHQPVLPAQLLPSTISG